MTLASVLTACDTASSLSTGSAVRSPTESVATSDRAPAAVDTTTSSVERGDDDGDEPRPDDQPGVTEAIDIDRAAIQSWLDEWRQSSGYLGAVVGVMSAEDSPVFFGSGWATRDQQHPMDAQAPFFVASLTKTFVAAVVLQLAEEGELDLDDRASDYVDLWPAANSITIRQLLAHTSGLPSVANTDSGPEWQAAIFSDLSRVWSPREALAMIADVPLLFAPGQGYHYSNGNYIVAGLVVEAVTGNALADELRTRIFDPLDLKGTSFDPSLAALDPRMAEGIQVQDGKAVFDTYRQPVTAFVSVLGAAGGIVSTPADMLTWMHALYATDEVVGRETREQIARGGLGSSAYCPCAPDGTSGGYGHNGYFPGFGSIAAHYPEHDLSLVIYVNTTPADLTPALEHLAGLLIPN